MRNDRIQGILFDADTVVRFNDKFMSNNRISDILVASHKAQRNQPSNTSTSVYDRAVRSIQKRIKQVR